MSDLNSCNFTGNVTRDGELKSIPSGTAVLKFGIAVNDKFKDKVSVCFINCTMWGKFAEAMAQYIRKGGKVAVSGKLSQNNWVDKATGSKRSAFELQVQDLTLLGGKPEGHGGLTPKGERNAGMATDGHPLSDAVPPSDDMPGDDSIPF